MSVFLSNRSGDFFSNGWIVLSKKTPFNFEAQIRLNRIKDITFFYIDSNVDFNGQ